MILKLSVLIYCFPDIGSVFYTLTQWIILYLVFIPYLNTDHELIKSRSFSLLLLFPQAAEVITVSMSTAPASTSTGYGPSTPSGKWHKLQFDGDADKYELWEAKFLGHMSQMNLKTSILPASDPNETVDLVKNEKCYSELIQFLDDVSLSLVMREAADDGRKAFKILRTHYAGKGESRLLSIYTELTSLVKTTSESVTDFILRAEKAATALRNTGESFSDGLLICVILKGLPEEYKPFSVVITQREERDFGTFKVSLRNYEETEKLRGGGDNFSSMRGFGGSTRGGRGGARGRFRGGGRGNTNKKKSGPCYTCNGTGHHASECPSEKQSKWCDFCKSNTHQESACRKKGRTNQNNDGANKTNDKSVHSFTFVVKDDNSPELEASVETPTEETSVEEEVEVTRCAGVTFVNTMLVDSGATSHIIKDESMFTSFDDTFKPKTHSVELADGRKATGMALKRGEVPVSFKDSAGNMRNSVLKRALYIPSFPQDLFSVNGATEENPKTQVTFGSKCAVMTTEDGTQFIMPKRGKLWFIDSYIGTKTNIVEINTVKNNDNNNSSAEPSPAPSKRNDTLENWHKIMGHCNKEDVLRLENVVDGMKISSKSLLQCEPCILGKETQHFNREPDERATSPMEFVHTDLAGPVAPTAREGFRYVLSFIDDYSGAMFVYFLKLKSEAPKGLLKFLADSAPYGVIKKMRSDGGGEFISNEVEEILVKNKIKIEGSAPYSPHQNGTAERGFRTQFEMARCLLVDSKLPKQLWTYALMASVYIRNRCYSQRTKQTPYFLLTGKKPNISNMHIFGTFCYPYQVKKRKLDDRCKKGIFLGYDGRSPAYIVYYPECNKILNHRCVTFTDSFVDIGERKDGGTPLATHQVPTYFEDDDDYFPYPISADITVQPEVEDAENLEHEDDEPEEVVVIEDDGNVDVEPEVMGAEAVEEAVGEDRRYPARNRHPPNHLEDYVVDDQEFEERLSLVVDCNDGEYFDVDFCCSANTFVPKTYKQAVTCADADRWKEAMDDEINSLYENNTYEIVPLPEGKQVVGGRWVYAVKIQPGGAERYKARYVAQGFSQKAGRDYFETFAPTAKMTTVRMLMQIAAQFDLVLHQLDVRTAYLNAPLDCEIYMNQPKGYEQFCDGKVKMGL